MNTDISKIKIASFAIIIIGLILVIYLFPMSYNDFITEVLNATGVKGKENKLQKILTERVFFIINFLPFIILIFGFLMLSFSETIQKYIREFLLIIYDIFINIRAIKGKYLLLTVVLIGFIFRLYYASIYPAIYDEAWTYINYTSKGILTSISYYNSANNHILNSVLTNLTGHLPFSQTINLRLPSILISTLSIFIFYLVFKRLYSSRISIYITLIFTFLYPVIFYGYLARGYSFIILGFIISFYGAMRIVDSKKSDEIRKRYWGYLSLGAVFGLYSIPSFVYPYFALVSFLILHFLYYHKGKNLWHLLISVLITAIMIMILYSPAIIVFGFASLVESDGVNHISRYDVVGMAYEYFVSVLQFLFYSEQVIFLIVFLGAFALMKKRIDPRNALAIYVIIVSPFIILIHSVLPPVRIWVYLVIPVLFLLGFFMKYLYTKRIRIFFSVFSVITSIILVVSYSSYVEDTSRAVGNSTVFALEADRLSKFLISNNANNVYVNHPLIETNIIYTYNENNVPLDLVYSTEDLSTDEILESRSFDYLITSKKFFLTPDNYIFLRSMCTICSKNGENTYIYIRK